MPGELEMTPRSMIMLEGTGTDFDQTYYIDVIERRLRLDGGLTSTFSARNTSPRTDTNSASDAATPQPCIAHGTAPEYHEAARGCAGPGQQPAALRHGHLG